MRLPFDKRGLELRVLTLENALLRSGSTALTRKMAGPEEAPVQSFGEMLFETLLTGEVLSCYDASQQAAREQRMGLRLKLRIQAPEMAALPWEFLYDTRQEEYVCLSRRTPLVRYVATQRPVQTLAVTPPLRILGLVVSPDGLPKLDTQTEKQRVEEALQDLQSRGLVRLTWLAGQTWSDLQTAMWNGPWHIFHFIGHGGFDAQRDEGMLALADAAGQEDALTATQVGRLLADHDPLRLAAFPVDRLRLLVDLL
jgi:hypothetical protein